MSRSALMMNRWLTIVLALLIALQSVAAIGDANRPHHPEALHHIYDHEHSQGEGLDSGTVDSAQSSRSGSSLDHSSDHCHQNHAHFHVMLVSTATDIVVSSAGQGLSGYQANHTSVIPPSLFRPPIA